jgi:hypothetical protein
MSIAFQAMDSANFRRSSRGWELHVGWREGNPSRGYLLESSLDGNRPNSFIQAGWDILTLTTAPFKTPPDGRDGKIVVVWEKMKAANR